MARESGIYRHWARAPEGSRIYAIGDLHGRLDLLDNLHALIRDDASSAPGRVVVVYLGDYIDRGRESRELIDRLLARPLAPFEAVHLKGNHEDLMLEFLDQGTRGGAWLHNGGNTTMESYGVTPPGAFDEADHPVARQELARHLPRAHRAFYDGLKLSHREGDYLFVHAGVRPGVALTAQEPRDLVWVREVFLESDEDFGACVVHGHTITGAPVFKANRIGLDTGAYRTDRLTCGVLEADTVRILQT